ncbi:MAG: hypothetical protein AB1744_12795, partial [Candidatus Zixiibacteriota bacterium]
SISPTSFTLRPGGSRTLTATLTSDGVPVAGKTITWAKTAGSLSATSGATDSSGRVSVTYTAPSSETTVTITASFAGDDLHKADSGISSGTIAKASTALTITPPAFTLQPGSSTTLTAMLTSDGAPLAGKALAWNATSGSVAPSSGTTNSLGQAAVTYTAPSSEGSVAITASFAGDNQYLAGGGGSSGAIKAAPPLQAVIEIKPDTVQIGSAGEWVTCYVELPTDNVAEIDVSSIRLNGTLRVDNSAPTTIGDYDNDDVPDLMVKFDRASVESIVSPGLAILTVTGDVDDLTFIGSDTVDVIRTGPKALISVKRENDTSVIESRHESYDNDLSLDVAAEENRVAVTVDSRSTGGRTVAINVGRRALKFSSLDELEVSVDNRKIAMADDYDDALDTSENDSEYLLLAGAEGIQALVSISHFSTHVITIERVAAQPSEQPPAEPQAGIPTIYLAAAAGAIFAIFLVVVARMHFLPRKVSVGTGNDSKSGYEDAYGMVREEKIGLSREASNEIKGLFCANSCIFL